VLIGDTDVSIKLCFPVLILCYFVILLLVSNVLLLACIYDLTAQQICDMRCLVIGDVSINTVVLFCVGFVIVLFCFDESQTYFL